MRVALPAARSSRLILAWLLALAHVLACDPTPPPDDVPGPDEPEEPIPAPVTVRVTSRGAPVETDVGPQGGTIEVVDENATWSLAIPAGALETTVSISVAPAALVTAIDGADVPFTGVVFGPSGLQFATPATLTATFGPGPAGLVGVRFDDEASGAGEGELVLPDGVDDTYSIDIPHFSGAGFVEPPPGAFGDILVKVGALPQVLMDEVPAVATNANPERLVCGSVVQTVDGRPLRGVPLDFSLDGPGRLIDVDRQTSRAGTACARWDAGGERAPVLGDVVAVTLVVGDVFPSRPRSLTQFVWGGTVPTIRLSGVATDDELALGDARRVCGTVSFDGGGAPLDGYTVRLSSSDSAAFPLDITGVTDASGEVCGDVTVPASLVLDADRFVDVVAEVSVLNESNVDLAAIRIVDAPLVLTVVGESARQVIAGSSAGPLCVEARRAEEAVVGAPVDFVLAGVGALSPQQVITDENGRACVDYTPPAEVPDAVEVVTASVAVDGRSATATISLEVAAGGDIVFAGTLTGVLTGTQFLATLTVDLQVTVLIEGDQWTMQPEVFALSYSESDGELVGGCEAFSFVTASSGPITSVSNFGTSPISTLSTHAMRVEFDLTKITTGMSELSAVTDCTVETLERLTTESTTISLTLSSDASVLNGDVSMLFRGFVPAGSLTRQ